MRSRQLAYAPPSPVAIGDPSSAPTSPAFIVAAQRIEEGKASAARLADIKADPQFQSELLDVFSALNQLMRLKGKTYPIMQVLCSMF